MRGGFRFVFSRKSVFLGHPNIYLYISLHWALEMGIAYNLWKVEDLIWLIFCNFSTHFSFPNYRNYDVWPRWKYDQGLCLSVSEG